MFMRKTAFRVNFRHAVIASLGAAAFSCLAHAQSVEPKLPPHDTGLAPLFEVEAIFDDGTRRIERQDQSHLILKRVGKKAYLKFENDPEVWSLDISTGAGNVELFKNDIGRLFLRISDSGNLSLITPDYPGEPISVLDEEVELGKPQAAGSQFDEELSTYISVRLGRVVELSLPDNEPADRLSWMQDAARIAVKGMTRAAEQTKEIKQVQVSYANVPNLKLGADGVLHVLVNPSLGYDGRVSSDRVILFLKRRLNS